MKRWITATGPSRCASSLEHAWKAGERIVEVSGDGWSFRYCGPCGQRLFRVGDDPGEQAEAERAHPRVQIPSFSSVSEMAFDYKAAQSGERDE